MSFLRRFKGALNSDKNKSQKIPKSVSCGNISQSGPSFDLPGSSSGPLADFIAENEISCSVDLGQPTLSWDKLAKQKSRLSKTTKEVLHDHSALGYFIQYLEARDAVQLVKFWLDVESFRSSASAVISTSYVPPKVSRERLQIVPEFPDVESRLPENSESTESFDSGFGRAEFDASGDSSRLDCEELHSPTDTDSNASMSLSSSILTNPEKEVSRAEHIVKTRTEDAVKIYRRYIAPDCQRPVHLPTEYKRDIVELICAETGHVAHDCFDAAQEKVVEILEIEYFPDFLKSEFHAKHQVDVLTGGQVYLTDILYNDTALSHFMEFLESENKRPVIEFWLAATNFNQAVSSADSQGDAMILYDKYFSMQATSPLGFNDSIRLQIENNICTEGGPDQACFQKPLEIIVKYLEKQYLHKFLASSMYKNYVKELIGTITASPRSFNSVPSSSCPTSVRSRTDSHSDTHSDCSSDFSSSTVSQGAMAMHRNNNTLLAMSSGKMFRNVDRRDLSFDKETTDPDMLWKRNPVRNKVGRINSFGRYEPGWDLAPEMSRADGTKKASRFSKAVKKLVTNDEHEKLKEEMAWQVAEMIVRDVTSVTMPEKIHKKRTSSLSEDSQVPGAGVKMGESRDTMIRKSMSESINLADCSLSALEIPTAKYF
eukprot:GFUD01029385.1.p1 GENE.GFUD01029385.1~~GFUD01029385.1.p1  ORF type:complete len:656 (+),score=193.67 GFUD01029385.1:322-2289(+)